MHAHIPNCGLHTQTEALAHVIDLALNDAAEQARQLPDVASAAALVSRLTALSLLWRTYTVLAGNFEFAGAEAICAIARLERSGAIPESTASELLAPFYEALGELYVDAVAAQPE